MVLEDTYSRENEAYTPQAEDFILDTKDNEEWEQSEQLLCQLSLEQGVNDRLKE